MTDTITTDETADAAYASYVTIREAFDAIAKGARTAADANAVFSAYAHYEAIAQRAYAARFTV